MTPVAKISNEVIDWLLEQDEDQPGVRYFALQWLSGLPPDHPDVIAAQQQVMQSGPVPKILAKQEPGGFWHRSDNLYLGGIKSTSSQIHVLASLGASGDDPRIRNACELLLERTRTPQGGFTHTGNQSGVIHCLNGNMVRALITLGFGDDERVAAAIDWAANTIIGRDDSLFRKSGTTGPLFACGYNGDQPCAWGAVRELRALAVLATADRSDAVQEAIDAGVEFLLTHNLVKADFPTDSSVSDWWTNFGFPTSYQTDLLELLLTLGELGYGSDRRLKPAIDFVLEKRNEDGLWTMEKSFNGRMYASIERRGRPSKWITLRAAKVVTAAG